MKQVIIILLSLIALQATAQESLQPYSIKGTISQVEGTGKVYIRYIDEDKRFIDSVTFANHQFSYQGKIKHFVKGSLALKLDGQGNTSDVIEIFIEGGVNLIITGKDNLKSATIKGGPVQADADALKDYITGLPQYKEIWKLSDSNKVWIKTDTPKAVAATKKIRSNALAVQRLLNEYYISHPDSYMTLLSASSMKKDDKFTDTLYNILTPRLKNSYYGKKLKEDMDQALSLNVGKPALDFEQPDVAGKKITLKSYKGKYVLIDFWASWCAPCRAENPNVAKAYELYKGKNFTVLGISLDDKAHRENWIKAIAKDGLTWTQVSDLSGWNNQAAKKYGINAIPQNYLIDPNGIIIGKNLRGDELEKKLASILN
jgi:peroxiredoxin